MKKYLKLILIVLGIVGLATIAALIWRTSEKPPAIPEPIVQKEAEPTPQSLTPVAPVAVSSFEYSISQTKDKLIISENNQVKEFPLPTPATEKTEVLVNWSKTANQSLVSFHDPELGLNDYYRFDRETGQFEPIVTASLTVAQMVWSGKQTVIYLEWSNEKNTGQIIELDLKTGQLQDLYSVDNPEVNFYRVSNDLLAVHYPPTNPGYSPVILYNLKTKTSDQLVEKAAGMLISDDKQYLAYCEATNVNSPRLAIFNVKNNSHSVTGSSCILGQVVFSDNSQYLASNNGRQLLLFSLPQLTQTTLADYPEMDFDNIYAYSDKVVLFSSGNKRVIEIK